MENIDYLTLYGEGLVAAKLNSQGWAGETAVEHLQLRAIWAEKRSVRSFMEEKLTRKGELN